MKKTPIIPRSYFYVFWAGFLLNAISGFYIISHHPTSAPQPLIVTKPCTIEGIRGDVKGTYIFYEVRCPGNIKVTR